MNCKITQLAALFGSGLLLLSLSATAQICRYISLEPNMSKIKVSSFSIDFGQR